MARIVFCALHFSYFRNYDSAIRELASRGHHVHLMADQGENMGGLQLVEGLAADWPQRVTWSYAPSLDEWEWRSAATWVRRALEYIRFLRPYYDDIPKYRLRSRDRASRALVALFAVPGVNREWSRRVTADALTRIEQAIPAPPVLVDEFRRRRADLVMLASATNPGGPQLDHLKAAMTAGARSIVSVWSWDHLSGKTWLRLAPNRVLVWNVTQRDEVTELHGLPAERVAVTGAQCYDQWFGRMPSRTREAFFADHHLDPSEDLLLYVCSVLVRPAPDEAPFVRRWIEEVRASGDPRLRDANIMIRPHPERLREWEQVDLSGLGRVAVAGRNPVDRESRDEYFDSLYFSRFVVGLVTSAFLEAAVVGRPVFTVMKPEFRLFQMGTPHFRYLVTLEGGLLHTADDWPEHLRQLRAALDDETAERERLRRFVEAFVRPHGLEHAATPDFVAAVEGVIGEPPQTMEQAGVVPGATPAVAHLLKRALAARTLKPALLSRYDREYEALLQQHRTDVAAAKSRIEAERTAYRDRKAAQKVRAVRARDRERRAKAWSRWRRGVSARKQLARLKSGVKQMIGVRWP